MLSRRYPVGFIISCMLSIASPALAIDVCISEQLAIKPSWISTIQFDDARNEILIADPKTRNLLFYQANTGKMGRVPVGISPVLVTKIQGGFFVESDSNVAFLAPDRSEKKVIPREMFAGGAIQLKSLYSNWITQGPNFVGFGSMRGEGSEASGQPAIRGFKLGFVRGTVTAGTQSFENVRLIEENDKNDFYLLGLPYFAANDDGLFYVRMIPGEKPSIKWILPDGTVNSVSVFPEEFGETLQPLKKEGEASDAAHLFGMVASRAMPYGLFGEGHYLYLLTRQPSGEGTQWLIHRINPATQQLAGFIRLPTTAEHLSVVVGKDEWYFVERGSVRAWGDQDISTIIRIPQAWITSPGTSRLDTENSMPPCLRKTHAY